MDDPDVAEFIRYLEGEKDASKHTIQNYLIDIRQFCEKKWGTTFQRLMHGQRWIGMMLVHI